MTDDKYIVLHDLLQKDLQLDQNELLISGDETVDLNTLHKKLAMLVSYLMQNDMHRLLNAMYRLDVSEVKFHDAMQSLSREEAAIRVADLIIEREMQKVKTRLHYKKHGKF